jgi:hypothetical protein
MLSLNVSLFHQKRRKTGDPGTSESGQKRHLLLQRYFDLARKAFGPPIKPRLSIQLGADDLIEQARAKTLMRWRLDRWAVGLSPAKDQLSVQGVQPFDFHPSLWNG